MEIELKENITKRGGIFLAPNGQTYASAADYFEKRNQPANDVGTVGGADTDKQADEGGTGTIEKEN